MDDSSYDAFGQNVGLENAVSEFELPPRKPKAWGKRHTLSALGFWGFWMAYAMRFNLSLAIVGMVKPNKLLRFINSTGECDSEFDDDENLNKVSESTSNEEFDWDANSQGLVLGSFFWGYFLTQFPGGLIATHFGGKWPLGLGLLVSGIMTLFTPIAARTNISMLIFVRIVEGLAQGTIYPSAQQILAKWVPPNERSFLSAICYSGAQFGAAFAMITSGYLVESKGGWESVFYFTGIICIVWFLFWTYLVYNTPSEHPSISIEEKIYIQASIGDQASDEKVPTPWKALLTSRPVWVISICEFGHTWGIYTLLMELPTFFKDVLKFDIEKNSWLSATPYLIMLAFAILVTYVGDLCISKHILATLTVRKICHVIAEVGAGLALIGASFIGCSRTGAVILLTIAVSVSGAVCGSYLPNQVEIACNHAGMIMAIANTIGNLAGFSVAIVTGQITQNHSTQDNWKYVFLIAAGVYLINAVIYVCFATVEEQSWNRNNNPPQQTKSNQPQNPVIPDDVDDKKYPT